MAVTVPQPDFGSIIQEAGPNTAAGMRVLWQALSALILGTSNSGTVQGPASTTVGDVALWNNTAGTLLKDVAFLGSNLGDYSTGTLTLTDTSGASLAVTINSAHFTRIGKLFVFDAEVTYPVTASGAPAQLGLGVTAAGHAATFPLYTVGAVTHPTVAIMSGSNAQFIDAQAVAFLTNAQLSGQTVFFAGAFTTT